MTARRTQSGRLGRAALWLAFPFVYALRPGFRTAREGMRILRDVPTISPSEEVPTAVPTDDALPPHAEAIRRRTRQMARFYATLCTLAAIWWAKVLLIAGHSLLSPPSVEMLAVVIVLGGQFVIQSFANWQIRTGGQTGFSGFLAEGRNIWPR